MRRAQVPNGELTAKQLRFLAGCIEPYGEKGCADITTRANLQLRGLTLGEADQIMAVRYPCGRLYKYGVHAGTLGKQPGLPWWLCGAELGLFFGPHLFLRCIGPCNST